MSYNFFVHSSISERFDRFLILALMNNVTVNIGVHFFFKLVFSFSSDSFYFLVDILYYRDIVLII